MEIRQEPAPPTHTPPRMTTNPMPEHPKVWRVTELELDEIMSWLPGKLKERWPRLNEDGLYVTLKAAIADRHVLFFRTPDVVGVFDVMPGHVLESRPIVNERFVRQANRAYHLSANDNEQGLHLYAHIRDWGKQIGAAEFNWGMDTDQSHQFVSKALQDIRIGSDIQKTQLWKVCYFYG